MVKKKYNFPMFYDSLEMTLQTIFDMLAEGANNRDIPAHTPSIATIDNQNRPQIRTLVLREFNRDNNFLRFHTDKRSTKLLEFSNSKEVGILIYDALKKIQIRLDCTVFLHDDDEVADKSWLQIEPMSQICYQVTKAPGTVITNPGNLDFDSNLTNSGKDNFIVILAKINAIEWLYLHHLGHRRANFVLKGSAWKSTWLVP